MCAFIYFLLLYPNMTEFIWSHAVSSRNVYGHCRAIFRVFMNAIKIKSHIENSKNACVAVGLQSCVCVGENQRIDGHVQHARDSTSIIFHFFFSTAFLWSRKFSMQKANDQSIMGGIPKYFMRLNAVVSNSNETKRLYEI